MTGGGWSLPTPTHRETGASETRAGEQHINNLVLQGPGLKDRARGCSFVWLAGGVVAARLVPAYVAKRAGASTVGVSPISLSQRT